MRTALIAAFALLAACSAEEDEPPAQKAPAVAVAPSPPAPSAPAKPAAARMVDEQNDLLEFTYGWPSEAAAIPKLNAQFEKEMREFRADALKTAAEDKAERGPEIPFNGHYLKKVWETFGSSGRLLSIAASVDTFTGGAHGNSVYHAMLWDRQADKAIEVADLFTDAPAAFALLTPFYCSELDKQRAEKREEPLPLKGDDWMTQCRPLAEQTVAPADTDGDGRFDLMKVLIEPYNSGPYAEGTYEVDIPVTSTLKALVKPQYAGSF